MKEPLIDFSSGNPLQVFRAAAEEALRPSYDAMREYPKDATVYVAEQLRGAPAYFESMGINLNFGRQDKGHAIAFSQGVTHGYNLVLKHLMNRHRKLNAIRTEHGQEQLAPAIIMPVPTYGFFFQQAEALGIKIIRVSRDRGDAWRLKPQAVAAALEQIATEGKYQPIAYFDSNPNNPTGLVRQAQETGELAEVFQQYNQKKQVQDKALGLGQLDRPSHQIMLIDDLIYYGLQRDNKNPSSFLNDSRTKDNTFALFGVSKIGLVGFRAGLVVCHPTHRKSISKLFHLEQDTPEVTSVGAAKAVFSGDSRRLHDLQSHLTELNATHNFGGLLLRTLVKGADPTTLVSADGNKMVAEVSRALQLDDNAAAAKLQIGLPGVSLASNPESGFFQLLGFDSLRSRIMPNDKGLGARRQGVSVSQITDLHCLFLGRGVSLLQGKSTGLSGSDLVMRASHALPPRDIVLGIERMRLAISSLKS